jgi:hypothetical protein
VKGGTAPETRVWAKRYTKIAQNLRKNCAKLRQSRKKQQKSFVAEKNLQHLQLLLMSFKVAPDVP